MSITQVITPLPTPPNSQTDTPEEFSDNATIFVAAQVDLVPEMNIWAGQANALADQVSVDEIAATLAAEVAVASANFMGTWVDQMTALGQSWYYAGILYRVLIPGNTSPVASPSNWASLGIAAQTHAAISKTTPVDADEVPLADSVASFGLKKLTWANIKATLKDYFDTLYVLKLNVFTVVSAGTYTVLPADVYVKMAPATNNCTVTLPAPSTCAGRKIFFRVYKFDGPVNVISASANIIPISSITPTDVIVWYNSVWIELVSDGTYWVAIGGEYLR